MLNHRKAYRGAVLAALVLVTCLFAATAEAQQCGSMDVLFIVDETGSMTQVIAEIQAQIGLIADTVVQASGDDYQFGLLGMPDNNVDVLLNFGPNNRTALDTAVLQLDTAGGCGGVPYDEALDTAINLKPARTGTDGGQIGDFVGPWRAQTKLIILVTDTWPQSFTCIFEQGVHDVKAHDLAVQALAQGIRIAAVYVPTGNTPEDLITGIMLDVAQTSQGPYRQTKDDASDLAEIITEIIQTCGGGGVSSSATMILNPREVLTSNLGSTTVLLQDFIQGPDDKGFTYTAEGLPPDSKITITPTTVDPNTMPGAFWAQNVKIEIGPETPAGSYVVTIRASRDGLPDRYVTGIVVVDCRAPFIYSTADAQPQNQSIARGGTATLRVVASGDGPFRYQWYQGSRGHTAFPIAGATGASYTTPALNSPAQYWVRVSNPCGSYDSFTATVTPQ